MKKLLHKTCLSGVMLALFAILTAMGTAQAKEVTVTQTKFSEVSGKLVDTATEATDPYISYESAQGKASTAPAIYDDNPCICNQLLLNILRVISQKYGHNL